MKEIRCELCREVVAMCCCVRCEHCSTLNTETVRGVLRSRCAHCRKGLAVSEDVEMCSDCGEMMRYDYRSDRWVHPVSDCWLAFNLGAVPPVGVK